MKKSKNILIILFLVVSLTACRSGNEKIQKSSLSNFTSRLDALGQSILDEGEILGFSIAIDSAGKIVYSGSFGYMDAEKTKPVVPETRFDIASVSKLIGTTVIMKLVEEGKLNLEQTLNELLPEFPETELAKRIKLRHLISHTSGLPDYALEIDSLFNQTRIIPEKHDFLSFFEGKNLIFEPGSNYQYCNSGFMMMAFIAENKTNQKWQELVDTYINQPTGLDFQLIKYAVDLPEMSPIFDYNKGGFYPVPTWVYVIGDGGLTATTEMLAKFPFHWSKIINQSSFEEMVTPIRLNKYLRSGYGYGVRTGEFLGEPIIGHTGGWKSTYSIMAYFPDQNLTFAGLMNTDGTPANMSRIFALYASLYLEKNIPSFDKSNHPQIEPANYVGEYHGYGVEFDKVGTAVSIKLTHDERLLYCMGENCEPLVYLSENKFFIESYPYDYIEFQTDDDGSCTSMREYYYGFFQALRIRLAR